MGIVLALVIGVCLAAIACFALSQVWLALAYRQSKNADELPKTKLVLPQILPRVLIQLPIFNEKYVVERLLKSVTSLDYPKELLTIQLLDDSTDDTVLVAQRVLRSLALQGHQVAHIRRSNREGFKAGALQYGLGQNASEFVVVFDADFLPTKDFIKRILCHFADPEIGMVQTKWVHTNANYSILTKLMALAIDNHFSVEQGGRQAAGCMINFNGTAGMWRRKAIDDAGGWSADCLTEDLDLSFRAQFAGWKFKFVEDIATPSELPTELQAIRNQQRRWTKGAVETSRKNLGCLWASDRSLLEKLIGTSHMVNSSIFLPLFVFEVAFLALSFVPGVAVDQFVWFAHIPLAITMGALFYTYWVSQRTNDLPASKQSGFDIISKIALFLIMTAGFTLENGLAALEGLIGKVTPFVRTPKLNIVGKKDPSILHHNYRATTLPVAFYGEVLAAGLFIFAAAHAAWIGRTAFFDISLFFATGYSLMIFFTLKDAVSSGTVVVPQSAGQTNMPETSKYPAE